MKHSWKHILSLLLAAAMLFALVCPALADNEDAEAPSGQYTVTWEKIDAQPRGIGAPTFELADDEAVYSPNELVRVSIVLDAPSTLAKGYSKDGIGLDPAAGNYRQSLKKAQENMAKKSFSGRFVIGGNVMLRKKAPYFVKRFFHFFSVQQAVCA